MKNSQIPNFMEIGINKFENEYYINKKTNDYKVYSVLM
jgi:hypothetical protein